MYIMLQTAIVEANNNIMIH